MRANFRNKVLTLLLVVTLVCAVFSMALLVKPKVYADYTTNVAVQVEGASVRVNDAETSGIKFYARLNKTEYDQLYNDYDKKVKAGMIIVPTDYIESAGGYTFGAFKNANLTVSADTIKQFKSVEVGTDEYYEFSMSLTNLKDHNYTTDFEGIVYIEIESDEVVSGAEVYNEKYYLYAERNVGYARNIYEVSSLVYNDRSNEFDQEKYSYEVNGKFTTLDSDGLKIAKTYMDGVADVKLENSSIVVANNTEYYTSPYSISKDGDNYYVYSNPKAMLYNGERKTDKYAVDGDIKVSATIAKGAIITENGATIDGVDVVKAPGRFYQTFDAISNNNYVAIAGEYGVGTYIDFYFTGNNMPSVMFFANKINGNMTGYSSYSGTGADTVGAPSNEKGLIITNGFEGENNNAVSNGTRNYFMVYGPNRINVNSTDFYNSLLGSKVQTTSLVYKAYNETDAGYNVFTHTGLKDQYASTNLKYTVGTYDNQGELMIDATIYNADTDDIIGVVRESTGLATSSIDAGNIVIYGAVKGTSATTQFTYSKPYNAGADFVTDGATFNADGSVTLAGSTVGGDGGVNHLFQRVGDTHRYIAFKGEYGVGTYMDFYFTGANMPQVMFFANNINGYILNYESFTATTNGTSTTRTGDVTDNKGLLFSNGIWLPNTNINHGKETFRIWGPDRIKVTNDNVTGAYKDKTGYLTKEDDGCAMSYTQLSTTYATTKLKYVVGTFDNNGDLGVDAKLYNAETGELIYSIYKVTSLKTTDVTADNIVVYGMPSANTTTFSYTKPYQVENNLMTSGVTFNIDGSVTLDGNVSAGGYVYHVGQHSNSYVALKGDYGIGTYIDLTYTGNNMPNVMFFADQINGDLTSDGGKGVILMNGIVCANTNSNYIRALAIYGPNRINDLGDKVTSNNTYSDHGGQIAKLLGYSWNSGTSSYDEASYPYLSQMGLDTTPDTTYKLTVGTAVSDLGKLIIDIYLYSVTADSVIYDEMIETSLMAGEVDSGSIVLYGAVKGASNKTTFSYSQPYFSGAVNTNEIDFETDIGTTFTAKNGGVAEISSEKAFKGARSLKITNLSQVAKFNLYGFKPIASYVKGDIISLNMQVYLDAPAGSNLKITNANGEPYTYLDNAQTPVESGAWTEITVDIPVSTDIENYLDISFKVDGIGDLSGVNVFVDNVKIKYNNLLEYSFICSEQGLGGNTVYMLPCATSTQNMSFIVVNSDGEIIVIDGGYTEDAENIIDMLKVLQPNVEKPVVTAWLLTHGHIDHISAISEVINRGEVEILSVYHDIPTNDKWETAAVAGYDSGSGEADATARTNLFNALETANIPVIRPVTGQSIVFGSATFDILYTPTDNGTFTKNYGNNTSVIYKLITTEKSVLFLGDAGTDLGNWLVANKAEELSADIVQMAHHGQNGVRQDCYQLINPSVALWPTPQWLWDNRGGTGTYETLTVRGWMEVLGANSYVSKDGIIKLS